MIQNQQTQSVLKGKVSKELWHWLSVIYSPHRLCQQYADIDCPNLAAALLINVMHNCISHEHLHEILHTQDVRTTWNDKTKSELYLINGGILQLFFYRLTKYPVSGYCIDLVGTSLLQTSSSCYQVVHLIYYVILYHMIVTWFLQKVEISITSSYITWYDF